jgi:prolyl oligopeptidase
MRTTGFRLCVLATAALLLVARPVGLRSQSVSSSSPLPPQPVAPVKPVTDDYYGTKVVDPYRYMENLNDPEVQSWFKGQDAYTRSVLAKTPGRDRLLARIKELDQTVPQIQAARLPSDLYLVYKQTPGEDVSKTYKRKGLNGQDTLLVDPEKVKLAPAAQSKGKNTDWGWAVSQDGKYLADLIVPGGSELDGELHVFDIETGRETGDVISRIGAIPWQAYWLPDNRSFVYGHIQKLPPGAPESEVRQKFRAYLHVLGTDPAKDKAVFGYGVVPSIDVDPSQNSSIQIPFGSKWALGLVNGTVTKNSAYYIAQVSRIGGPNPQWRKIADMADGVTQIVVHGDELYALTYKDAPRYKAVRMDARKPGLRSAEVVVPAGEAVIDSLASAQDALYVQLLDGGINRILRVPYGPHPQAEEITLPFKGSAYAGTDPRLPGALLYLTSWTKAFKIYIYDPSTKRVTDTKLQPAGPYDNPENIESIEVKAKSYDGTLVPLSIIYRKGIKLDGSNPTWLYGYGAYGASEQPYFDLKQLAWFESGGGVLAICHVRGGGEYGEEWHLAGKMTTKPNTWKDFIACAEYLIDNKYTSPAHLAGEGASAGGILIGRAITERPNLFNAALDRIGNSDMLRSETSQSGAANIPEYGTTKTDEGFKALLAMSAYHHVEEKTAYPAVLLETGMNDPRVSPWQMSKMTARLQAGASSGKPVLLRVDFGGGHGVMGATQQQEYERSADEMSFLLWQLGIPGFQPPKR